MVPEHTSSEYRSSSEEYTNLGFVGFTSHPCNTDPMDLEVEVEATFVNHFEFYHPTQDVNPYFPPQHTGYPIDTQSHDTDPSDTSSGFLQSFSWEDLFSSILPSLTPGDKASLILQLISIFHHLGLNNSVPDTPLGLALQDNGPFIQDPYDSPHTLPPSTNTCISGCGRVAIPQRPYPRRPWLTTNEAQPGDFIGFSANDDCGISMSAALQGNFAGLEGRDDSVFVCIDCGTSISLRIEWPGYPSWTRQMRTQDWQKHPQPIKKSKLAREVSRYLEKWINEAASQLFDDNEDPKWRVGANFIRAEHVVLVALERVSKGSWQPHFRLV